MRTKGAAPAIEKQTERIVNKENFSNFQMIFSMGNFYNIFLDAGRYNKKAVQKIRWKVQTKATSAITEETGITIARRYHGR